MAVFSVPVIFPPPAKVPMKVLPIPVVLDAPEAKPTKTFALPLLFCTPAELPKKEFPPLTVKRPADLPKMELLGDEFSATILAPASSPTRVLVDSELVLMNRRPCRLYCVAAL